MDSKLPNDEEFDNELVFQNLTPEQPANAFQKSIIHLQDNWPPHWNKRHVFLLLTVLSSLLIFFLVFKFIYPLIQQHSTIENGTIQITTSSSAITTTNVAQMLSYNGVIFVLVTQISNNTGKLEALNAQTGKLVWDYSQQNVKEIKLFSYILYIQTDTNIIALDTNTRTPLWETPTLDDNWQIDQNVLFTVSTNGIVTALNAYTGTKGWQTKQPSSFWQVHNGIFYTTSASGRGLSVLSAYNGQQLWHNANINQDLTIDNDTFYLQNNEKQRIQAYDSRTGKIRWQFNTHGKAFTLSAQNGFLLLSDLAETQVEVINGQTGKLLWQRQGILNALIESPNQTVVSSVQKNETDIIRTTDGTTLYHFPRSDALLTVENGLAFFIHFTQDTSIHNPANYYIIDIEAVRISNGATIWGNQSRIEFPLLQNNTIGIVPIGGNSLLLLRADNGYPIWQHTFDTTGN